MGIRGDCPSNQTRNKLDTASVDSTPLSIMWGHFSVPFMSQLNNASMKFLKILEFGSWTSCPSLSGTLTKRGSIKPNVNEAFVKRYQSLELVTFGTRALPRRNGPQGSLEVH